jgi:hypothetical protein
MGGLFRPITRRVALPVALGSALLLIAASAAFAVYVHPSNLGALKQTSALVTSFKQCTSTNFNDTHSAPLSFSSCNPPAQSSANLTIGGKAASSLTIQVYCTNSENPPCPTAGDQEDVKLIGTGKDVRCKTEPPKTGQGHCPLSNGSGKNDYDGQLTSQSIIRITDSNNTPSAEATVQDIPFSVGTQCVGTPSDDTVGGTCNVTTTADTVVPGSGGAVQEGKKANVEIAQIQVFDGGLDGNAAPNPLPDAGSCPPSCITSPGDTLFEVEGIYIP